MTGRHPFSDLTKKFTPKRKARVAAKVRALKAQMPLAELRQAREQSQKELARALKIGQPAVAKLERRADMGGLAGNHRTLSRGRGQHHEL
jgi:DNA-binding transcriptional regulator YiaG